MQAVGFRFDKQNRQDVIPLIFQLEFKETGKVEDTLLLPYRDDVFG